MFLSSVFPIGDQSSVNLRGTYDSDNVTILQDPDYGSAAPEKPEEKTMEVDQQEEGEQTPAKIEEESVKEADDYTLFWSLQRIFSFPPNLIKAEPVCPEMNIPTSKAPTLSRESKSKDAVPADLPNLRFLRYAGNAMLDLFTEANRKEKDLAGAGRSSTAIANQRAVDSMSVEEVKEHYFFPKFLTSRTLFDLEVRSLDLLSSWADEDAGRRLFLPKADHHPANSHFAIPARIHARRSSKSSEVTRGQECHG